MRICAGTTTLSRFPKTLFDLSEVYGVSSVYDMDDSLFDVLKKKLQKPHAVRVFGARSAAAFVELLDPAERVRVLREIEADESYFFLQDVDATVFLRYRSTRQVFDEGERTTVDAIELLRESADRPSNETHECGGCSASRAKLPKAPRT